MTPTKRKPCNNEKILEIYFDILQAAQEMGLTDLKTIPDLYWTNSANNLGMCKQDYWGNTQIMINACFDKEPELASDTLVHEIGHYIAGNRNGHNVAWRYVTNKLGQKFNYVAKRLCGQAAQNQLMREHYANNAKYTVYCPSCGKEWHFPRMNKYVKYTHAFRCNECHTVLERK